jgi:hypothetical protein
MGDRRLAPAARLCARYVGQVLGARAHQGLVGDELRAETVRHACLSRQDAEGARTCQERYIELARACGAASRSASKSDLL